MKNPKDLIRLTIVSLVSSFLGALFVYLVFMWPDVAIEEQGVEGRIIEATTANPNLLAYKNQPVKALRRGNYTDDELNNIEVYQKTNQAVVNITAMKSVQVFNWFFEPIPRKDEAIGSGSIIDREGYVLTNNHVVQNASELLVTLYDGSQFEGRTVGTDPENDLAIVSFDPKGRKLQTIDFVEEGKLEVGLKVFAIGNPYGFERTLTIGIISGLGRPIQNENGLIIQDMIQTDASINPGNSGGPLLNSQGEMIGVNSSIYSPSGGSVGLGFAVPISTVKRVLPDLIRYGEVRRGWIDIETIPLFPQLVRYNRLSIEKGLLISQILEDSEAEKAGLRGGQRDQAVRTGNRVIYLGGDIITKMDDQEVASMADLYTALEPTHPGDYVDLTILRSDKILELRVKLSSRKKK